MMLIFQILQITAIINNKDCVKVKPIAEVLNECLIQETNQNKKTSKAEIKKNQNTINLQLLEKT